MVAKVSPCIEHILVVHRSICIQTVLNRDHDLLEQGNW